MRRPAKKLPVYACLSEISKNKLRIVYFSFIDNTNIYITIFKTNIYITIFKTKNCINIFKTNNYTTIFKANN